MKRSLFIATAMLLCVAAGAASAQDRNRKDRDRPAPSAPPATRSQPAPVLPRQQHPVFQPQPQPQPRISQPSAAFQPAPRTLRTAPPPTMAPQPRADRIDRDQPKARPDRIAPAGKPDKLDKADKAARPELAPRPIRPDRPSPALQQRDLRIRPARPPRAPRPPIPEAVKVRPARGSLPTRPVRAMRPVRPASPAAIARTRAIHQALKAERVRTFRFRGRTLHAFRARPYRYPAGWRYRAWRRHQHFPAALFLSAWFINDFLNYGLSAPPPGYSWVRYGPDAVLVDGSDYDIADTAYGVFDDGSAYEGPDDADLPPIDPDLPREFTDGSLDLAQGADQSDACDFFYGDRQTQDDIDAAWQAQDWNGLAKTVIWAGCGNDLSYYLLGLAAEGLALPDAAAGYYGRAVDLADGDADSTFKCAQAGEDACRGLDIGAEASQGLDRIYGPAQ